MSPRFAPGNQAALRHGLRSRVVRQRVRQGLLEEQHSLISSRLPDLLPVDGFLVDLLADALADLVQIRDYVNASGGPISPRGQLRRCMDMYRGRLHDAVSLLDRLAVGPKARSQFLAGAATTNSLMHQLARRRQELGLDVHPQAVHHHNGGNPT